MLKKCLRYDLKSISTFWILGAIAMLAMSIPGGLALRSQQIHIDDIDHFPWEVFVLMIVYFVMIAFFILTEILVYVRYYKHFFSDEGYLTFTLPVKRRVLFTSKVINGVIWQVASVLLILICAIIMMCFVPADLSDEIVNSDPQLHLFSEGWAIAFIFEAIIIAVLALLLSVLSMYFFITLGATIVRKNKIIVTIGIIYGANIVTSFLSYVFVFGSILYGASAAFLFPESGENVELLIFLILAFAAAVLFTVCVAIALITLRMLERKLNLA